MVDAPVTILGIERWYQSTSIFGQCLIEIGLQLWRWSRGALKGRCEAPALLSGLVGTDVLTPLLDSALLNADVDARSDDEDPAFHATLHFATQRRRRAQRAGGHSTARRASIDLSTGLNLFLLKVVLVRQRRLTQGAGEFPVKRNFDRSVNEGHWVVATRGGELAGVNNQSVTM